SREKMATESSRILFLICFFPWLTYLVTLTFAVDRFFTFGCVQDTGNYTANSAYERDLNGLFNEISSITKPNYGFFYSQYFGEVDALALCRGDIKLDDCTRCLNETLSQIKQNCPQNKEAIGWSGHCMIHYSSRNISGRLESSPVTCRCKAEHLLKTDELPFFEVQGKLLNDLGSRAAAGGSLLKYAAGNSSLNVSQSLFALVQCTPDLTEGECNACLTTAMAEMRDCCIETTGGMVFRPSCYLRFETYPFFDAAVAVPNPQPPPDERSPKGPYNSEEMKQKKSNWIPFGASLSAILGLALFSACGFFIWKRRTNIQENGENRQEAQLLDLVGGRICSEHSSETFSGENVAKSQEFLSFQLHILHAATDHFADKNKLGEGGFGSVYKVIMVRNFYWN
ncbi:hypothetical protein POUND7_002579, partial [Theobroma cacao]